MKQKINLRLAAIAFIAILATAVGVTCVYYGLFHSRVRSDLRTNAQLLADTGFFQGLYAEAGQDPGKIDQDALNGLGSENLRITWIRDDGTVLYDNDTAAASMGNHLDRPEIRAALEGGSGESSRRSDTLNMNTFYYALLLSDHTILRISTQARSIYNMILTSVPVILIVLVLVLLLCILIAHLLTVQLLQPINRLAEDCCKALRVSAEQRNISLTCLGSDTMVTGERELLKELLENLVQNSVRYNHEHGWVRVKVSSENGHAVLSVSDNGIGIPADQQERVFERFYRVDKSRSRETGGTGLGLSIIKHIAELHNAEIRLQSQPEKGTCITVLF